MEQEMIKARFQHVPFLQPHREQPPLPFPPPPPHKEASTKGHGRGRIENRNRKKDPARLLNLSEQGKAGVLFTLLGAPSLVGKVTLGRP